MAESLSLADGRTLAWAEYGEPRGRPLFYFHGTPGSRLAGAGLDEAARARGVRVIAPDRPGCGRSTSKPGRRLLDWPSDVRALADSLRIERFAVAGVSGGGPYAVACAWALPERVTAAAALSGIGPTDVPGVTRGMDPGNRGILWIAGNLPVLVTRAVIGLLALQLRRPERAIPRMMRRLPKADRDALADPVRRERLIAEVRESVAHGTRGALSDFLIFSRPWGFSLGEIRVPVLVWHGELDRSCPVAMARYLAAEIPGCRATLVPGEGHLSPLLHLEDVLKGLGL